VTEDERLVDFLAFEISALSLRAVPWPTRSDATTPCPCGD